MSKQISILGTGWLGLPLAKELFSIGYQVNGSTTSQNKLEVLRSENITPYLVGLNEEKTEGQITEFLQKSDTLIINIPPGLRRNPESNFVSKIKNLIPHIKQSKVQHVLFISSTSVFSDLDGFPIIHENVLPNAFSNAGKQLIQTEKLLQEQTSFKTTILRFAGLFDTRRHPATMLSKRKNIKNPKAPVNLIHLKDCVGIIKKILETKSWGQVFNASYPDHPLKMEYYSDVCIQMNLPAPDYDLETISKGKIIDASALIKKLEYRFVQAL